VTRGQGRIRRQLLSILKLKCRDEFERGITGPLYLENSLWNRKWTCLKTCQTTNDISQDVPNVSDEDVLPTLQIFYTLHNDSLLLSGTRWKGAKSSRTRLWSWQPNGMWRRVLCQILPILGAARLLHFRVTSQPVLVNSYTPVNVYRTTRRHTPQDASI